MLTTNKVKISLEKFGSPTSKIVHHTFSGTLIASSKMGITIFDLFTEILTKEWFDFGALLTFKLTK